MSEVEMIELLDRHFRLLHTLSTSTVVYVTSEDGIRKRIAPKKAIALECVAAITKIGEFMCSSRIR